MSIETLRKLAICGAGFSGRLTRSAIYNSTCECGDSDGCDGDCGGDCNDSASD